MSFKDLPCMQIGFIPGMQDIKEDSSKIKILIKSTCYWILKAKCYNRYLLNSSLSTCYVPKGL